MKGKRFSDESKEKMRRAKLGKKASPETKLKMSLARKGKLPKNIKLITGWNKGKKLSKKHREKLSEAKKGEDSNFKGKKHSKETKLKISEALKGKTPSKEVREKLSKIMTLQRNTDEWKEKYGGKNSSQWRGGITTLNTKIRLSKKSDWWRKEIFARDNYTCIWCGATSGNGKKVVLNADHIIPFSKIMEKLRFEQGVDNLFEKAMNYELLWDTNNGRTLCVDCHKKTDTHSGKLNKKK